MHMQAAIIILGDNGRMPRVLEVIGSSAVNAIWVCTANHSFLIHFFHFIS